MLFVSSAPLCLRCGYDLRGLEADKVCPECGLGVGRSLDPQSEFHRGRPIWLNKLSTGSRLLLATQAGLLTFLFIGVLAGPVDWIPPQAAGGVLIVLSFTHCISLLLLTWPENHFERRQPGNRLRLTLRLWAWNGPTIIFCMCLAFWFRSESWAYAAGVSAFLLAPCWALTFLYLRRLAFRVLDPSLAEHCAIVGCGMGVSIAAPFIFALREFNHSSTDAAEIIMFLIVVAIFLFVIWSTYLMVLFMIAFGRAARLANKTWQDADAARLNIT
jgi:hypothetical protein